MTRRRLGSPAAIDAFKARVRPYSNIGLIVTVMILFGLEGERILERPLVIALIAVPILSRATASSLVYGAAWNQTSSGRPRAASGTAAATASAAVYGMARPSWNASDRVLTAKWKGSEL